MSLTHCPSSRALPLWHTTLSHPNPPQSSRQDTMHCPHTRYAAVRASAWAPRESRLHSHRSSNFTLTRPIISHHVTSHSLAPTPHFSPNSFAPQDVVIVIFAAPVFSGKEYATRKVSLLWRAHLTRRLLDRYLCDGTKAFFKLAAEAPTTGSTARSTAGSGGGGGRGMPPPIDNPDQRISEDIELCTAKSFYLAVKLLGQVINALAFVVVLWGLAPKLVYFLVVYSAVATFTYGGNASNVLTGI